MWYVKFILGSILYAPEYAPTASFGGRIGSIQVFEWWHFNIICLILFDAYTLYTEYIIITYTYRYRSHIYNIRIPIFMALTILVKVELLRVGQLFFLIFPGIQCEDNTWPTSAHSLQILRFLTESRVKSLRWVESQTQFSQEPTACWLRCSRHTLSQTIYCLWCNAAHSNTQTFTADNLSTRCTLKYTRQR